MITPEELKRIMPRCNAHRMIDDLNLAMNEAEINTPLRIAAFLGQIAHESNQLTIWEENLNYSWERLRAVFRKYFPTDESAKPYHRSPRRIAARVYSNRLGNGDEASGDGWRYRGRGPIQLTGKWNYEKCGEALGVDLIGQPELAAQKEFGFRISAWFWTQGDLNAPADEGRFDDITRRINGGLNGKPDRDRYYAKCKEVLGI